MDSFKKDQTISLIVFGCGLAFGLSGMYTYFKTRRTIKKEMRSMSLTIESLKNEIEQLKTMSQRASPTTRDITHYVNGTAGRPFMDEVDHESEEDEFFDFSEGDNQEGTGEKLDAVVKRIDKMFEDPNVDKSFVFQVVSQACETYGKPEKLMYRKVKASNYLVIKASNEGNIPGKKKHAFETVEIAKQALNLYPESAECNKWFAIAIGGISDFVSTKEKIGNGQVFKDHVDKAISLAPNDGALHHMLGRFCSTIAGLSWIEKKVASTLFAEVPQATMEDSYRHLKRAYELRREWKENMLHLATAAFHLGFKDDGRRFLEEGLSLQIKGADDELAHKDLLQLNTKYIK